MRRTPVLLSLMCAASALAADAPIRIAVDATDAPRRLLRASLSIPVTPGETTLRYAEWIPGEHGPTGPIVDLAGIRMSAAGKPVRWERDPLDLYRFRCTVPEGADRLDVAVEYLSPTDSGKFTEGAAASGKLVVLSWNYLVLYPAGKPGAEIQVEPSLRLPAGWKFGTALGTAKREGDVVSFEPVSLATLIDSPVLAGQHVKELALDDAGKHFITIAADSEEALAVPKAFEASLKRLVDETGAMFGGRPYRKYRFLLTLSDHVAHFGLEHHESSDNRTRERFFLDDDAMVLSRGLLPHEMVHAWCGKFRRPAGLTFDDFGAPIDSSLLWVYEGLTSYLDAVLTARAGFGTVEDFREELALTAAGQEARAGRAWRPLADTATAARSLYGSPDAWKSRRRAADFYPESVLIWLEADVVIRSRSQGKKSLEDFLRVFFRGEGKPEAKPYTYDELVSGLQDVVAYDWRGFFDTRVKRVAEHAPLGGLAGAGWKLAYRPEIPRITKANESLDDEMDLSGSIGAVVDVKSGEFVDVGSGPADAAGIGPGMDLVAVNGRRFTPAWLRSAIAAKKPFELLVRNGEFYRTFAIDYAGGERHPYLERDPSVPDVLTEIAAPLRPPVAPGATSREGGDRVRN
jgi:predicted metalloprotease with PDZ domain